jgi:hypothetical protein
MSLCYYFYFRKCLDMYRIDFKLLLACVTHYFRGDATVFVAGSAATYLYMMRELRRSPKRIGWKPNDMDVFVLGEHNEDYIAAVSTFFINYFVKTGYMPSCRQYRNNYAFVEQTLLVTDITLSGHDDFVVSFIHYPNATSSHHVTDTFDIDIVQVALDPFSGLFTLSPETDVHIRAGMAAMRNFNFPRHGLTEFHKNKLMRLLDRMTKYERRGFTFVSFPNLFESQEIEEVD